MPKKWNWRSHGLKRTNEFGLHWFWCLPEPNQSRLRNSPFFLEAGYWTPRLAVQKPTKYGDLLQPLVRTSVMFAQPSYHQATQFISVSYSLHFVHGCAPIQSSRATYPYSGLRKKLLTASPSSVSFCSQGCQGSFDQAVPFNSNLDM